MSRPVTVRGWSSRSTQAYLRPTVIHCTTPEPALAKAEYMFPFVTVVECPQDKMIASIGPTLVGTGITDDRKFQQALTDATHIDRLNIGPIPTIKLDWLQPHEGNLVEFLFPRGLISYHPSGWPPRPEPAPAGRTPAPTTCPRMPAVRTGPTF